MLFSIRNAKYYAGSYRERYETRKIIDSVLIKKGPSHHLIYQGDTDLLKYKYWSSTDCDRQKTL